MQTSLVSWIRWSLHCKFDQLMVKITYIIFLYIRIVYTYLYFCLRKHQGKLISFFNVICIWLWWLFWPCFFFCCVIYIYYRYLYIKKIHRKHVGLSTTKLSANKDSTMTKLSCSAKNSTWRMDWSTPVIQACSTMCTRIWLTLSWIPVFQCRKRLQWNSQHTKSRSNMGFTIHCYMSLASSSKKKKKKKRLRCNTHTQR